MADEARTLVGELPLVGVVRASIDGREVSTYPLFRRPENILVGAVAGTSWDLGVPVPALRFEWDGVVMRVAPLERDAGVRRSGAVLIGGPTLLRPGEPLVAGRVTLAVDLFRWSGDETAAQPLPPTVHDAPTNVIRIGGRCFRPSRNIAGSEEPTRPFDLAEARHSAPDLLTRLDPRRLWRARAATPPRRQGGARATMGPRRRRRYLSRIVPLLLLLGAGSFYTFVVQPGRLRPSPRPPTTAPPSVAPIEPAPPAAIPPPQLTPAQRADLLKAAITAFREGHGSEAVDRFSLLAAAGDEAAALMVHIIGGNQERGR